MIDKLTFLLNLDHIHLRKFLFATLAVILLTALSQLWIMVHAIALIWLLIILCWCFAAGTALRSFLPAEIKMNYSFFSFNLSYASGYLVAFFLLSSLHVIPDHIVVYFFHLYFAYSILYTIFYISKSLVSIEENRKVDYFDYRITFYEFCFFFPFTAIPIHKRIQRVLEKQL